MGREVDAVVFCVLRKRVRCFSPLDLPPPSSAPSPTPPQDTSLDTPGAALPMALDPHTNASTPRGAMLQLERTTLSHALLYAVLLTHPGALEPATVTQLARLVGAAAARARAAGATPPHALQQQEYLALLAAVAALAPAGGEVGGGGAGGGGVGGGGGGAAGMRRLTQDAELAAVISTTATGACRPCLFLFLVAVHCSFH